MLGNLRMVGANFEDIPVLDDEDVLGRQSHGLGKPGVQDQVPVLTVNRHEVLRLDQGDHELQFFLARMSGHVNELVMSPDDIGAKPEQIVDRAADEFLVAWDGGG